MSKNRYQWAAPGDVNAFFGLMLDNIADLLLTVGLLSAVFGFPTNFALQYMVPGTAIGVLVGDVIFTWMAFRLARRIGNPQVTAMPLGLDTPSTFGMVFFVLGPSFLKGQFDLGMSVEEAAMFTWHIGIWSIVLSGIFKFFCAAGSHWIRTVVPRAGLLGSLAAIALVLISFLPFLEVLHYPIVGFTALAVILTTLVARIKLPGRIPGALGALLIAGTIYYLMLYTGKWTGVDILGHAPAEMGFAPSDALLPTGWFSAFKLEWVARFPYAVQYLPLVIPFALATVVGGIDCTESAAAAGDEFNTGQIIAVEGFATLVAGLCGGVIQTTPYIGHPAYKAMGGRAAYTLATALFVGGAGLIGYFGFLYAIIPKATVFPILIFIGLEITAQSFMVTPRRHYAAVAVACLPALAALMLIFIDNLQGQYATQVSELNTNIVALEESVAELGDNGAAVQENVAAVKSSGKTLEDIAGNPAKQKIGEPLGVLGKDLQTLRVLSGGFIIISLLWASALAAIIDRRLNLAGIYFVICAGCALFGIIHSPLPGSPLVVPWNLPAHLPHNTAGQTPIYMAAAYLVAAALMFAWGWWIDFTGVKLEPLHKEEDSAH